ncbi:MAG: hypothetical protein EA351_00885 [Gemmatimonadales bacterium]|nr:MAG: hypothetical protein EA351_00885 [Gemmatimonadales bacterium]
MLQELRPAERREQMALCQHQPFQEEPSLADATATAPRWMERVPAPDRLSQGRPLSFSQIFRGGAIVWPRKRIANTTLIRVPGMADQISRIDSFHRPLGR